MHLSYCQHVNSSMRYECYCLLCYMSLRVFEHYYVISGSYANRRPCGSCNAFDNIVINYII